jgi:hypothetical protein
MSEDKKPRKMMSPKGFIGKATKPNISAAGFLAQHREYMLTGEMAIVLAPIVAKVDAGEIEAAPALDLAATLAMHYINATNILKGQRSIQAQGQGPKTVKVSRGPHKIKDWTAAIYNSEDVIQIRTKENGEEEEMYKEFDKSSEADRWIDRRLSLDCSPDCYGEVIHTPSARRTVILRDDALARFYKKPKGPTMKPQPGGGGSLSFRPKVKESKVTFSGG